MYVNALKSEEHDVTTVFLRGDKSTYVEEAMEGSKVIFFELPRGSMRGMKLRAVYRVIKLCLRERFDVVIAHRYKPIYVAGMAGMITPFKLVLGIAHEHDVFKRLGRRMFLRFWAPNIKIAGVSKSVKADILQRSPTLKDRNRVFNLPNCIDGSMQVLIHDRDSARDMLGLDKKAYIFGTIGRLVKKKQHEVLIRALAHKELSECMIVIIGGGVRLEYLQSLASKLGVRDRCVFAGHVHQAFRYIKAFNTFVLPSGEKEAFGLVLLEAMMAQIPIISSNAKGPQEVVGDTGLLFKHADVDDLVDQMVEIRSMPEARITQLVDAAYERLVNSYEAGSFKERFWSLPPIENMHSYHRDTRVMECLNTLYQYEFLPKPVRHSIYRKLRRRGVTPSEEFTTDFFGLTYRGNIENQIEADVFFYGGFEKPMLFFLSDFITKRPGAFVDVGANVGNHSMYMSKYAKQVHSFEPFPRVLAQLISQVKLNQLENVMIHEIALGNESGNIPFFAPPEESLGGGTFIESVSHKHGERPVVELPIVRGDDYFAEVGIDSFCAIKIDVEGFEIPVLEGLSQTLNKVRPLIVMEVTHGATDEIDTTLGIQAYLPDDYSLYRFENRDDGLFRHQTRSRKRTGQYKLLPLSEKVSQKRANVVACPKELQAMLPMGNC
jgi:FkbM family methyltransferase